MSEKKQDQELDLVAEDITVEELQDEQVVENVEVSDEETTDVVAEDADSVEEATDAEKEVNGEKAAAEVADTVKKSAPKQAAAPKTKAGLINASYKETILKLEDQIETLVKLNEKLFEDKAKLKHIISVLSGK